MAKIYNNLTELIGRTPLLRLSKIEEKLNLQARLVAKLESFNPGGSAKDRIALAMIEQAERDGLISQGGLIVEPTSGNTGIGLAWVGAVKGYRVILVMPETMSIERRKLVAAYGAEIVLTPGAKGMAGAVEKAKEIVDSTPNSWMPLQFDNPANPAIHTATTAEEVWQDTDGEVDFFVAGVGTGGTVSGVAEGLKKHKPSVKAVAVEPASSAILSGGKPGPHVIQGIGANFIPKNYHAEVIDEIIPIANDDSIAGARLLTQEGILAGYSSGAALQAAIQVASREENKGKTVVVLLPDTGERYLSTTLFDK